MFKIGDIVIVNCNFNDPESNIFRSKYDFSQFKNRIAVVIGGLHAHECKIDVNNNIISKNFRVRFIPPLFKKNGDKVIFEYRPLVRTDECTLLPRKRGNEIAHIINI